MWVRGVHPIDDGLALKPHTGVLLVEFGRSLFHVDSADVFRVDHCHTRVLATAKDHDVWCCLELVATWIGVRNVFNVHPARRVRLDLWFKRNVDVPRKGDRGSSGKFKASCAASALFDSEDVEPGSERWAVHFSCRLKHL